MKKVLSIKLSLIALLMAGMMQKAEAKDALEKGFTLKLAFANPSSTFGTMPSSMIFENPLKDGFVLQKANMGFGFQLGTMYYINAIDLGDQMKIGLDVTWLSLTYASSTYRYSDEYYYTNPFSGTTETRSTYAYDKEAKAYNLQFMMEIGPMFSFSPMEKMAIDASFKLSPTAFVMGAKTDYTTGDNGVFGGGGFGFRYTPAFYFRYSVFLVGAEFNLGNINGRYGAQGYNDWKGSTNFSTTRIVLGFKF